MAIIGTKKIFSQAFYHLLLLKPLTQITVNMILAESGLSRATFYRHFRDKYELMNYYYQSYFESLNYDPRTDSWQQQLNSLLSFIKEHRGFFDHAQKTAGQNSFLDFLLYYSVEFSSQTYRSNKGAKQLSFAEEAAIIFFCSGSIAVMRAWFEQGLQQEPEEIAALIFANTPPLIQQVFR